MVEPAQDFPDFTRGMLLLGVDGDGNQVGVLLDDAGNLNCILKGQGATGLETISVDENGRIQAFVLDDESQWGNVLKVGSAELAARLGSVKAWDWRGKVLVSNDFSSGVGNCQVTGSGAGYSASCSPDYSVHGGYALKVFGGSDASKYAKCQWLFGKNPSTRLGLEVAFSNYLTFDYVNIGLLVRAGGNRYNCRFQRDPGSLTLKYQKSDGTWGTIVNTSLAEYPYSFNYMKIVADFATGYYERFILNAVEYDLSGYAMQAEAAGFLHSIEVEVQVYSVATKNYGIFLDYFTVTLAEPANA